MSLIYSTMEDKDKIDKYDRMLENQRKACKVYYNKKRQVVIDKRTAALLRELLHDTVIEDMREKWPETLRIIQEVQDGE